MYIQYGMSRLSYADCLMPRGRFFSQRSCFIQLGWRPSPLSAGLPWMGRKKQLTPTLCRKKIHCCGYLILVTASVRIRFSSAVFIFAKYSKIGPSMDDQQKNDSLVLQIGPAGVGVLDPPRLIMFMKPIIHAKSLVSSIHVDILYV